MSASALLRSLFDYKAWANDELLRSVAWLDADARKGERHAAIRLLNHTYVVDRIFAAHLEGRAHAYAATNTPETPTLDALAAAIAASDRWFVGYLDNVTPDQLAEARTFVFTDGGNARMTRAEMLMHVIVHGGYHRGAVGRILDQAGIDAPRDTLTRFLHGTELTPRRDAG